MQSSFWTSMPGVSGKNLWLSKFTRQALILSACIVMSAPLTGCGGASPQTSAVKTENPEESGAVAPLTGPVAAPPGADKRPLKPGQTNRPLGKDGLPQLQAKGINYEQLFTERISDDNRRFERVENAVMDMRRDFEAVLPAVMRLVAVEDDIQNLVGQLETLLRNEPSSAPLIPTEPLPAHPMPPVIEDLAPEPGTAPTPGETAAPAVNEPAVRTDSMETAQTGPTEIIPEAASPPEAAPPPPTPISAAPPPETAPPPPAPATSVAGNAVSAMRFGVDGGKTRIVFDSDASVTYKKDLDNDENLLVVELPGMGWNAGAAGTPPSDSHVQSWTAQPLSDAGGTRVIMILRKPATVSYEATLKPEPGSPHHRLVLDLR